MLRSSRVAGRLAGRRDRKLELATVDSDSDVPASTSDTLYDTDRKDPSEMSM